MIEEFSAGGVVYKKERGELLCLVAQHSGHHGWVFPKGFIGDKIKGENKESTAIREVKEETGVYGEILYPLTPVAYWYQMDKVKHHKTVYYFVMRYKEGDIKKHDWEMENVEWLPFEDIEKRLSFPSDKKVWKEAKEKIKEIAKQA